MDIKPLGDRVLIEPVEREEKTESGIVIPDSAKEKPQEGRVIATGEGKTLDNGDVVEPAVNEGDIVIHANYAGTEINHKGKDYLIVNSDDILAIVE